MLLSDHFSLDELTVSTHKDIPNVPGPQVVKKLTFLCDMYLERLRSKFGPLHINSGYRSIELNTHIGGSKISAHMFGCAADIAAPKGVTVRDMMLWCVNQSGMNFDQVIDEQRAGGTPWLHFGIAKPGLFYPRKQAFIFRNGVYSLFT